MSLNIFFLKRKNDQFEKFFCEKSCSALTTERNCEKECPFECHYDKYSTEVSYASFPSTVASKVWADYFRQKMSGTNHTTRNVNHTYLQRNLVGINVYFTSNNFLEMVQEKQYDI